MFKIFKKIWKIFAILVVLLFIVFLFSQGKIYSRKELDYGITFSKKQAESLNLDWRVVYLSTLDDLGVKKLRLPAYWNEINREEDVYDWDDLDWQIEEAGKRGVEIILAAGGRLPRWPECHFPDWAEKLDKEKREEKLLLYIDTVIKRYKDIKSIVAWQIENEPFLSHFGDCPELDSKFLDKEIAIARSLDSRPIVVTDSGELSVWWPAARRADIFGTTMYRDTYSTHLKRYVHYPIKPGFFRFKKNIVDIFTSPKEWIVIELQAEPWAPIPYQYATKAERDRTMEINKFREMLEFARKTGFRKFYLWGAEWWYWEKETQGNPEMWEEAKKLF